MGVKRHTHGTGAPLLDAIVGLPDSSCGPRWGEARAACVVDTIPNVILGAGAAPNPTSAGGKLTHLAA